MQFFLYDIVARAVALYLCVDIVRVLRDGLAERQIGYFNSGFLNGLLDSLQGSKPVARRDTAPFRYWFQIVLQVFLLLCCLVVAVHGWWHPDA